jgi:dTDP-glucose 4,6-dehydratase
MKLLVTGGCGFIGTNFIRLMLRSHPDWSIVNLDKLTYAGNRLNLADLERGDPRYRFVQGDICDRDLIMDLLAGNSVDAVVNFAAESHVDRSISDPSPFVTTNVQGAQNLLECARQRRVGRFVHISTDEVYGTLGPQGKFTENTPLAPNSPYSASKAGADLMARAYFETYGFPALITRCSNNYGPYQFPEKLIPLMYLTAMADKPLPVYGDGLNVRDWIHVSDHCRALVAALRHGRAGRVYNFGGSAERTNLQVVRAILGVLGIGEERIRFVEDRPGHDLRYAIDATRAERELGWRPTVDFEEGLRDTVRWYQDHEAWWRRVKSGEYRRYYEEMYRSRGA